MTADPLPAGPAVRVLTLYPDLMDVYADRGNLLALRARARATGVALEERTLGWGEALPAADLVLIGGGQDREQRLVAPDLARHAAALRAWAAEGVAMLAVCGGFQLFGHWYRTQEGEELPGTGVFDITTVSPEPGAPRLVGDVVVRAAAADLPGGPPQPAAGGTGGPGGSGGAAAEPPWEIVGFENHAGRTYLGPGARPLGRVLAGWGNNGEDGTEGAVRDHAIGTYLHGPLLPRHPALCDRLLAAALRHRGGTPPPGLLSPPADPFAERAHRAGVALARKRGHRVS